MSLQEKISEFTQKELIFELPDGEKLELRPVRALEVITRLGVAPSVIGRFLSTGGKVEEVPPEELAEASKLASRLEEAYYVFGIAGPVKLRFTYETEPEDAVPVAVFRQFLTRAYGPEVVSALEKRIREISGEIAPREVAQDRASFREVAPSTPLPG